jgi:DNA-binding IclR family transcriptional regulator
VKSLSTALQIYCEFTKNDKLSVSTLTRKLGLPKSQVSRVLATFRESGLLVQNDADKTYQVARKAYALGCRYLRTDRLAKEAFPSLRAAVDRSGYTATISVLDGVQPLYLLGAEGSVSVDFGSRSGTYFPVHATAPGKVLLAFSEPTIRDDILAAAKLEKLTTETLASPREIRRELSSVLRAGYSISRGERMAGIGSVAVPVFANGDTLAAALGLVYPLALVADEQAHNLAALLHEVARTLSSRLGATSYPFGSEIDGGSVQL